MSLSENSPFPFVTKESHSDLFQGFQWLKEQEKKWNGEDHKKQESWTWHLSPCHQGSPCQLSATVCVRPRPGCCSFPWWQISLPRQFSSHLLIGQHHHSTFPGKPPPGCFRPKDNWDSIPKTYPKQAGFQKGEPFRGKFPQTALMIFWIMNQGRAAAGAEPGVSGNSQSGCQIKTSTNKSTSTLKGMFCLPGNW